MRIDAHQHFWKYNPIRDAWIDESMTTIQKDFYPEDLQPILELHGFNGCVAIQADPSDEETLFLCDLGKKNNFIKAVVGWVDLNASDLEVRLEGLKNQPKLVGFREILQGKNPSALSDPTFRKGIATLNEMGYTYDVLIFPKHLPATLDLVKLFPYQKFVIDHLAKPKIKSAEWQDWESEIKKLSAHENVYCKLSGMVTEADWKHWKPIDFQPYFDCVLETFGSKRLMYGSDWPVCLLAAEYREQLSLVEHLISNLSEAEQAQIMGETACQFYGIS
jgi:L-fuconolactonase